MNLEPRSARHVFVQRATPARLEEFDLRAEYDSPAVGAVIEADYLHPAARASGLVGWFRALMGESDGAKVRVTPPFSPDGDDVFDYFDRERAPFFDGHDDPLGETRHARGTIACLQPRSPGDTVVVRDFWVTDEDPWRVTDAVDFGLVTPSGRPVGVCCAMAPLVVARPTRCTVGEHLATLEARHLDLLTDEERAGTGRVGVRVELHEGDTIEVLGVVCDPSRSSKRFDLQGRGAPFRSAAAEPLSLLLGDMPGIRMVIRVARVEKGREPHAR